MCIQIHLSMQRNHSTVVDFFLRICKTIRTNFFLVFFSVIYIKLNKLIIFKLNNSVPIIFYLSA